jgi:hypothetical protein
MTWRWRLCLALVLVAGMQFGYGLNMTHPALLPAFLAAGVVGLLVWKARHGRRRDRRARVLGRRAPRPGVC